MKKCNHNFVYKIMQDHRAADVCTICGEIRMQGKKRNRITRDKKSKVISATGPRAIAYVLSMLAR